MSDNPFQSPQSDLKITGVISGERADLRSVAVYQRGIMIAILVYIGCLVAISASPAQIRPFVLGVVVIDGLVGTVLVFLLSLKVYGVALGIVFGIGTLVPCINLIVLLCINAKATNILKSNGIKVGFLGANPADVK